MPVQRCAQFNDSLGDMRKVLRAGGAVTNTPRTAIRQPQFRQSTSGAVSTGTSTGDGGSLGVFSHANSPLKKATSMYDMQSGGNRELPRNSFDMARNEIQEQRERSKSPAKRQSDITRQMYNRISSSISSSEEDGRRTSAPGPFGGVKPRPESFDSPYKKGPSRW